MAAAPIDGGMRGEYRRFRMTGEADRNGPAERVVCAPVRRGELIACYAYRPSCVSDAGIWTAGWSPCRRTSLKTGKTSTRTMAGPCGGLACEITA